MQLIINDTILTDGEFKGQKALSVWKYNPNYFKELQKHKLAKVYIFPEYIRNLGDIDKVQKDNQADERAWWLCVLLHVGSELAHCAPPEVRLLQLLLTRLTLD